MENLFRAVEGAYWMPDIKSVSSAAFKDPNGCSFFSDNSVHSASVIIGILRTRLKQQAHYSVVAVITSEIVVEYNIYPSISVKNMEKKNLGEPYHLELHESQTQKELSDETRYLLSVNTSMVYDFSSAVLYSAQSYI